MNFRVGQEVNDGAKYYKVVSVGKRTITCTRHLREYVFKASDLIITSVNRSRMTWDEYEVETVGSNLHLQDKELGDMIGRSAAAVKSFRLANNLKKIA